MPPAESATLSIKEEALAGITASIAAGCRPCTRRWMHAARGAGACERGIRLAVETGLAVRSAATREMADFAAALQPGAPEVDEAFRAERARLVEVLACGAALAVRSVEGLEQRIMAASDRGATPTQIGSAIAIARAVAKASGDEAEKVVTCADLGPQPTLSGKWCCETLSSADHAPCACEGDRK
jgi:alkylhydroperoxidase/carboxymuconolactone decarboxylase family protein YurZ